MSHPFVIFTDCLGSEWKISVESDSDEQRVWLAIYVGSATLSAFIPPAAARELAGRLSDAIATLTEVA